MRSQWGSGLDILTARSDLDVGEGTGRKSWARRFGFRGNTNSITRKDHEKTEYLDGEVMTYKGIPGSDWPEAADEAVRERANLIKMK